MIVTVSLHSTFGFCHIFAGNVENIDEIKFIIEAETDIRAHANEVSQCDFDSFHYEITQYGKRGSPSVSYQYERKGASREWTSGLAMGRVENINWNKTWQAFNDEKQVLMDEVRRRVDDTIADIRKMTRTEMARRFFFQLKGDLLLENWESRSEFISRFQSLGGHDEALEKEIGRVGPGGVVIGQVKHGECVAVVGQGYKGEVRCGQQVTHRTMEPFYAILVLGIPMRNRTRQYVCERHAKEVDEFYFEDGVQRIQCEKINVDGAGKPLSMWTGM